MDITELNFNNKKLTELPDLSYYPNLKILNCCDNNLQV